MVKFAPPGEGGFIVYGWGFIVSPVDWAGLVILRRNHLLTVDFGHFGRVYCLPVGVIVPPHCLEQVLHSR